jgi:uncharacterized protein YbaR (Trm112 family)
MKTPREIKASYDNGENISQLLKSDKQSNRSPQEIIEISYDMQTGSYIEAMSDKETAIHKHEYSTEIAEIIKSLCSAKTIMEAGVGEATTLGGVINALNYETVAYGFDLSWSRVAYAKQWLNKLNINNANICVGDLFNIPFQDNSIDVVYTSHSIEPNGGSEEVVLKELYRVTRDYLVLLEPSYELSNNQVRERMDTHGYCKNLEVIAKNLGYQIIRHELFPHVMNPLNPTAITIIAKKSNADNPTMKFACPKYKTPLIEENECLYSPEAMSAYPIIKGIPCLKIENSIFASKFEEVKP